MSPHRCSLCLVALSLIPLVRSEGDIIHVTTALTQNDTEEICDAVIVEFKLSKRRGEILKSWRAGYTVDKISNKLVISPFTTQTHIRHIYAKMNIHKRSELLTTSTCTATAKARTSHRKGREEVTGSGEND